MATNIDIQIVPSAISSMGKHSKDLGSQTTGSHDNSTEAKPVTSLQKRIEQFLVRNRPKFAYLHFGMFLAFLLLYLVPPFLPLPPDDATPLNNYFLFVKFAVWGVWFPLVLLTIIIFGRAWCGMFCPQGALSEFFNKRNKLSRSVPAWIKWEGTPIASFIIITIIGQLVGVRDYAKPMLLIFGGTTIIACIVGYMYTRGGRAWCRHLCPVGVLLGIFSRLGSVGIEKGSTNGAKLLCPTYIKLSSKASARHCIECMRCVNPGERGSLNLALRKPGKEIEDIRRHKPDIYEVSFLFLATGLALGGFHWIVNSNFITFKDAIGSVMLDMGLGKYIGLSGPWWTMVNYPEAGEVFNLLDFISISSYMLAYMVVIGGALFCLTFISSLFLKEEGKEIIDKIAILGYAYAPVALLSLILGLGAELFSLLNLFNIDGQAIKLIKVILLSSGVLWSLYLNFKLINRQYFSLIPNLIGVALVTWAWYPAI